MEDRLKRERLDHIAAALGQLVETHNSEAFMEEEFEERKIWTCGTLALSKHPAVLGSVHGFITEAAALANMSRMVVSFTPVGHLLHDALRYARQGGYSVLIAHDINMKEIERWPIK